MSSGAEHSRSCSLREPGASPCEVAATHPLSGHTQQYTGFQQRVFDTLYALSRHPFLLSYATYSRWVPPAPSSQAVQGVRAWLFLELYFQINRCKLAASPAKILHKGLGSIVCGSPLLTPQAWRPLSHALHLPHLCIQWVPGSPQLSPALLRAEVRHDVPGGWLPAPHPTGAAPQRPQGLRHKLWLFGDPSVTDFPLALDHTTAHLQPPASCRAHGQQAGNH